MRRSEGGMMYGTIIGETNNNELDNNPCISISPRGIFSSTRNHLVWGRDACGHLLWHRNKNKLSSNSSGVPYDKKVKRDNVRSILLDHLSSILSIWKASDPQPWWTKNEWAIFPTQTQKKAHELMPHTFYLFANWHLEYFLFCWFKKGGY
jgi:hypothetical protein